jgi:hypothetical protein
MAVEMRSWIWRGQTCLDSIIRELWSRVMLSLESYARMLVPMLKNSPIVLDLNTKRMLLTKFGNIAIKSSLSLDKGRSCLSYHFLYVRSVAMLYIQFFLQDALFEHI